MTALARSVLVTGSNRGIGLELVKQLAASPRPPQHIFATCRDPEGPRGKVSAGAGHRDGPEPGGRREFAVPAALPARCRIWPWLGGPAAGAGVLRRGLITPQPCGYGCA